jgi:hypothetical protein
LKGKDVRSQESLENLAPPRQLGEKLDWREGDMQIEADAMHPGQITDHLRD